MKNKFGLVTLIAGSLLFAEAMNLTLNTHQEYELQRINHNLITHLEGSRKMYENSVYTSIDKVKNLNEEAIRILETEEKRMREQYGDYMTRENEKSLCFTGGAILAMVSCLSYLKNSNGKRK